MSNIYRRDFLKGLTFSSAAMFVPGVFAFGRENSPAKTNHLIGLGTASYQVLLTLHGIADFHSMTLLDTEKPDEKNHHINVFQLNDLDLKNDTLHAYFDALFCNDDSYFVVAGLGGRTGNTLFVSLSAWMQAQHKNCRFTGILPFHFEGKTAMMRSKEALSSIIQKENLNIIELQNIRKQYGNLPLQSAMEKAHEEVLRLWEIGELNGLE